MDSIDKNTLKIFKYIYRRTNFLFKNGVNEGQLRKKFPNAGISMLVMTYVNHGYLMGKDNKGEFFTDCPIPFCSDSQFRYYTTPVSNKLVEDYQSKKYLFWFPYLITTLIALTNLFLTIVIHKPKIIEFFETLFD